MKNQKGANIKSDKLQNWAKRKVITVTLILEMIKIAENKGRSDKYIKSLWNTYHCLNKISTQNEKIHGKYCKRRTCLICNGIKKAEIINKYLPIVNQWSDPHFITLTVRSIGVKSLFNYMQNGMTRGFQKIVRKAYKKAQQGNGLKLVGIRSLECNFNPIKRTYNPHFHLIVENKAMADYIIKEWLTLWKGKAGPYSQKMRKVKNSEKDMIEVIKYGTKIFTDPTMKKAKGKQTNLVIYASAIENIIYSMTGKRQYEHFGFKLVKNNLKGSPSLIAEANDTKIEQWKFDVSMSDWVNNSDNNEKLTQLRIDEQLSILLSNPINSNLE